MTVPGDDTRDAKSEAEKEPEITPLKPVEPKFDPALVDSGPTGPTPSASDPDAPYGEFVDSTGATVILQPDESGVVSISRKTFRSGSETAPESTVPSIEKTVSPEDAEAIEALQGLLEATGGATPEEAPYVRDGVGSDNAPFESSDAPSSSPEPGEPPPSSTPDPRAPPDGKHNCGPATCWCTEVHGEVETCSECGGAWDGTWHWHSRHASPRCVI